MNLLTLISAFIGSNVFVVFATKFIDWLINRKKHKAEAKKEDAETLLLNLDGVKQSIDTANFLVQNSQKQLVAFVEYASDFQNKNLELDHLNKDLEFKLKTTQSELNVTKSINDGLVKQIDLLRRSNNEFEALLKESEQKIKEFKNTINNLNEKIRSYEQQ